MASVSAPVYVLTESCTELPICKRDNIIGQRSFYTWAAGPCTPHVSLDGIPIPTQIGVQDGLGLRFLGGLFPFIVSAQFYAKMVPEASPWAQF